MQMLADSYAGNESVPVLKPVDGRGALGHGAFVVQIWSRQGELLASSWPALHVALQAREGVHMVQAAPVMPTHGASIPPDPPSMGATFKFK